MFLDYLLQSHLTECCDILAEADPLRYYSVRIDFLKLFEQYPDIGDRVLCSPVDTLLNCDRDVISAQEKILNHDIYKERVAGRRVSVKRNVRARFSGLPVCPELHRTVFPKNVDVGCFLKVTGTVVRVTQAKMLEHRRLYVCVKCKQETQVEGRFEERYVLKPPAACGNACKGATFTQLSLLSREHCKDYQELKIQEQVNKLSVGCIPGAMWVVVEDDLVDCCKPGDDINICGTLRRRWRPPAAGRCCEVELVLQANSVEVCNSQHAQAVSAAPDVASCFQGYWDKFKCCPMKGRDGILATVCPQVYGLHLVKLALLLTVVTGSSHASEDEPEKRSDDGHRASVRGQSHLLLVGDPGTGKSQLLRAGAELTPRAVFTSGTGSTRAGLTCAALREEGEWVLEAGALVLSDGGVCCIDEIGQLREHDRSSIHEAMEQQTISIAKAGIVCKLNTRCAVIGACNPRGHYQPDLPLSANVALGTPLLSRFDLIFILLDTKNEEWDKLVSSYILFGANTDTGKSKSEAWSIEKLQMYIGAVANISTKMSKSAHTVLQTYYMHRRSAQNRDVSRTTVRTLDSLVRLSQAHCRLMYRRCVLTQDAVTAVSLVDLSQQDIGLRGTTDALHSTAPPQPDYQYLTTAKRILTNLNLHQIWKEELLYYSKLLNVDHKTLENEIEKENNRLFVKYDNVADDNVPLSCSIITSSYFKKWDESGANSDFEKQSVVRESYKKTVEPVEDKNDEINMRLAETLKKHSSMNKVNQPIPKVKHIKPRKRKVEVDSNIVNVNKKKKGKNQPKNTKKQTSLEDVDSSEENFDPVNILNNVPSVNDIFLDLDLNLNYEDGMTSGECKKKTTSDTLNSIAEKKINSNLETEKVSNIEEVDSKGSVFKTKDSVIARENKLKQFTFIQKRDLSKFYDEPTTKKDPLTINATDSTCTVVAELSNNKTPSVLSSRSQINSIPNSQISIFESSDCDADLEV